EEEDISVLVFDLGEGIVRMRAERDHSTLTEVAPQFVDRRMDGDMGEVVVVEPGAAQLRIGEIGAERLDEMKVGSGDRGEPDGVSGVAGDFGSVEDDVDIHILLIFSPQRPALRTSR